MSRELEYFPKAVPYFREFVTANLQDFYQDTLEYRTYPNGGYGSFYRVNEVIQVLINIYSNIEETFGNLAIPETFPSPKALARAWKDFYDFLLNDNKLFDDVYHKLGSKKEDNFHYPPILTAIDEDRKKVIDLLEHILSFKEVKDFLENELIIEPQTESIKYKIAPTNIFDLIIITAIHKEYKQVKRLLSNGFVPKLQDPSRTTYFQGDLVVKTEKTIKVLVACANQMGMTSASALASKMISNYTPKVVAMCGIAAGVNGKIGDIMIPDLLWDYGSGKSTLETKNIFNIFKKEVEIFVPYRYPIKIKQDLIGNLIRLTKETDINERINELGKEITFENKSKSLKTYIGPFVSGSAVIANDKILSKIKEQDGKLVGFDMEAFAIAYACEVADITPKPIAFIVKSISDFGNKKKSNQDKDKHQDYSAFTSANFLFIFIQRYPELFDLIETPSE